jgi:hypothetical protein
VLSSIVKRSDFILSFVILGMARSGNHQRYSAVSLGVIKGLAGEAMQAIAVTVHPIFPIVVPLYKIDVFLTRVILIILIIS